VSLTDFTQGPSELVPPVDFDLDVDHDIWSCGCLECRCLRADAATGDEVTP
jgi:hypothetical protein